MTWKWERPLREIQHAKLIVEPESWCVSAYFPGPDARYSGTLWTLLGIDVEAHAAALIAAWEKLEELEKVAPAGAQLSADAARNIRIVVKGYPGRGITVHQHHGLINSRDKLVRVLQELATLEKEALSVIECLAASPKSDSPQQLGHDENEEGPGHH